MLGVRSHNEGSLFLRADTLRWTAQVTMRDGSRPTAGCRHTDHKAGSRRPCAESRELLAELKELRDRGAPANARNATLGRYLETWLADVRGSLAPATWRKHESIVRTGLTPALGAIRLSDLSVGDARRYLAQGTLGAQTLRHHRATLRRALADAVRDGLIPRNVAALAEPPRMTARRRQYLDGEQARRLIDGTRDDRYHALWTLALTTGMREAEMLGLRWSEVDLPGATVHVSRTLHRTKPGDPDYDPRDPWTLRPPKTDKSRRTIPLTAVATDALQAHRLRQSEERLAAGKGGKEGLVFTTPAGQPIHGSNLLPVLYGHLERLGLPRVTIHDLRHSAASVLLAQGVPLAVIAAILGHSTIRVTADLYAHVVPALSRDAADRMQGAVG